MIHDAQSVYCCRFDEKCWVEEESSCRTVYDTVWENKCEMVSTDRVAS